MLCPNCKIEIPGDKFNSTLENTAKQINEEFKEKKLDITASFES